MSTPQEFKTFVEEQFVIDESEEPGITERQFVDIYCDHLHLDEERRAQLKKSHERMMTYLVEAFPTVRRTIIETGKGKARFLPNLHARDWRYQKDGTWKAAWSELADFVERFYVVAPGLRTSVTILRDEYNAFKKHDLKATSIGTSKKLMAMFRTLRRSIHKVDGRNVRCLEGIGRKDTKA